MFRFEFVVLYTLYVPMVWSIFPTTNTHVGKWQNKGIGKNDWTIYHHSEDGAHSTLH